MHLFEFLGKFFKSHPIMVIINLCFTFLIPVQDILLPHYYGKLIDSLLSNKNIKQYIIIVIVIFTLLEIGFILSDWHDIYVSSGFQTFTRKEILQNILEKYNEQFSDLNIGDIMSKIVKIPHTLVVWYERIKNVVIPYILVFGFAVCYFAKVDKILGGALLITAISYAFIIIGAPQTFCNVPSKEKDKIINEIHEQIDDTLRNFISMHGDKDKQKHEIQRLNDYEKLFTIKFAETMKCLMKTKIFTSTILLSFTIFFILRSYTLLKIKKLNTASFSSLFLILTYITSSMMHIESQLREMIFDWGIIVESDSMFERAIPKRLKYYTDDDDLEQKIPSNEGIGMINIMFGFPGAHKKILKDVSFHIKKGETVVILGNIGSGKSTILKLLLHFIEPDSGLIYIDGVSYKQLTIKQIKEKIGFVPQQPILFDRTVIENILYGTDGVTKEQVLEFIRTTGIEKEFKNLKEGIDARVGKNGSKLSGGQRQIVLCLRVIFQNHDYIIMDEPTASLDAASKETIKMLLDVIMKNKTVIIVTHDNELLKVATRKIYIENGYVVDKDEHEEDKERFGFMVKHDYSFIKN
jgi:ABC-type multidrug transport system fused ATPase/permease subunit